MINKIRNILKMYGIDVEGIEAYSSTTWRIKTKKNAYLLKQVDYKQVELIERVALMNIEVLEKPLANMNRKYVTKFQDDFYYLVDFREVESIITPTRDQFFTSALAHLHNRTFHTVNVEKTFFENIVLEQKEKVNAYAKAQENLFLTLINKKFLSPSGHAWIRAYEIGYQYIDRAMRAITQFEEATKDKTNYRVVINYNHSGSDHVQEMHHLLLGLHRLKIDSPAKELINWMKQEKRYDYHQLISQYLAKFPFQPYEKAWFIMLLYDLEPMKFVKEDYENCEKVYARQKYVQQINEIERMFVIENLND